MSPWPPPSQHLVQQSGSISWGTAGRADFPRGREGSPSRAEPAGYFKAPANVPASTCRSHRVHSETHLPGVVLGPVNQDLWVLGKDSFHLYMVMGYFESVANL